MTNYNELRDGQEFYANGYKEGYKQAILDGKTQYHRPQGEWIDTGSGQECNVCHEIQYGYDNFRHFCANCGQR